MKGAPTTHETTTTQAPKRAVIYCRVSGKKQAIQGAGLDSQEHRCRVYAEQRGYIVDAVFPDDVTGGGDFMKRPGMVALLSYLDAKPHENYVVIFDDLKRWPGGKAEGFTRKPHRHNRQTDRRADGALAWHNQPSGHATL